MCQYFPTYHYIDVSGFTEAMSIGTPVGIIIALTNTRYAHITNNFGIGFIRYKTQILYDKKLDIPGVTITTGLIQSISMSLVDSSLSITRNKKLQFRLAFRPRNPLPLGSKIVLKFPTSVKVYSKTVLGYATTFFLEKGLEDKDENNPVELSYNSSADEMVVQNYLAKTDLDEILLKFWVTTPDNKGESSAIEIKTYTDVTGTNVIDEDKQFAKIVVMDVPIPTTFSISMSETLSGLGTAIDVEVSFTPAITVPAGGFIKIIFDPTIVLNEVTTALCQIWDVGLSVWGASATCFKRNREVAVQINATKFTAGVNNKIKLEKIVKGPDYGGDYYMDVTTYQIDGLTKIESWTSFLGF